MATTEKRKKASLAGPCGSGRCRDPEVLAVGAGVGVSWVEGLGLESQDP